MNSVTLIPAYGRHYTSMGKVIVAFQSGVDFRVQDVSSRYNGSYCSIRDFEEFEVKLRYDHGQSAVLVKVKDGVATRSNV